MRLEKTILEYAYNNADVLGECLRDYCFVKNDPRDFGAYSTFKLRPEFGSLPTNNEFAKEVAYYLDAESTDVIHIFKSVVDDTEITLAWDWSEGDGILLFLFDNKALINRDCKKDSGWKFLMTRNEIEENNQYRFEQGEFVD